jgi:hypothetical protein
MKAGSKLGSFFDLEDGTTYSSEMSVDFWWITQLYILDDRTLHNQHCENLKPYISGFLGCDAV